MRSSHILACALLMPIALAACGDGDVHDNGDASGGDAGTSADASAADFSVLISRHWSIPPGETYRCTAVTLERDVYVNTFRAITPLGTHHTVLSVSETPNREDGDYDCGVNALEHTMLFASGVGTDDLTFPDGVAIKIRAGQQLHLNLHLFDLTTGNLDGDSGTQVKEIDSAQLQQEAEMIFGGSTGIFLAADAVHESSVTGSCQFEQSATLVALWPHQHQLGTHHAVVLKRPGVDDETLHDGPYDFNEQKNYIIDPVVVNAGDTIETTCTYLNDSGHPVTFGESSNDEMCFTGLYRYPATGAGIFSCVAGIGN